MRRPNFFSFETPTAAYSLRCFGKRMRQRRGCHTRNVRCDITHAMGWPDAPAAPRRPEPVQSKRCSDARSLRGRERSACCSSMVAGRPQSSQSGVACAILPSP